ncbi:hypothetical protein GCM10008967_38510 [Bacillus carboniphilus]|uniref:DUF3784 domain-containing protein n=1 Tax=Bacillus carboniphilus TaxID=86663 RepID=A0ABN0WR57_9BACI
MADIIITIIFLIPLYAVLFWTYLYPEESLLFGKRWMYEEEPQLSSRVIRYTKFMSLYTMIGLPFVIISFFIEKGILKLAPVLFFLVLIIGAFRILTDEKES